MKRCLITVSVLVTFFSLCSLVHAQVAKDAKLVVRPVLPSATDKNIDTFTGDGYEHRVYVNPAVPAKQQLVIFLPGTGGKGTGAKDFCSLAANEGFHVVSVAYPSSVSISVFHASDDADAFLKARENIIYGKGSFMQLKVNEANSIQSRIIKLLRHLDAKYPEEKWGQYLTQQGAPEWSKLIVSGHSQGGGHAALLGMQHKVARVVMTGAPKDFNVHFNKPGKWFTGTNATPLDRYFSFVHRADEKNGCSYPQQLENYRALKLLPTYEIVNVDEVPAPYMHSRLLTSTRQMGFPHGAVIANPVYQDVWKYMLEEGAK